ncbi:MAG: zinc ribbon domain-containing protein [Acidobacteriota bacterium]|nr:zinc ribbon domain-containing protein [Acidobacteriota bacterium]
MPIYEYVCQDCQTRYERLVLGKNGDISCPQCGSHKGKLQFSVFAAPHGEESSSSADAAPSCGCNPYGCGCN